MASTSGYSGARTSLRDDNVQMIPSQRSDHANGPEPDWWRTKTGVLVAASIVAIIAMIITVSINISAVGKMSSHEDHALETLKKAVEDLQNLPFYPSTTSSSATSEGTSDSTSGTSDSTSGTSDSTSGTSDSTSGTSDSTSGTSYSTSSTSDSTSGTSDSTSGTSDSTSGTSDGTTTGGTTMSPPTPDCPTTENSDKFDCHPEEDATEERCTKRGCCWQDVPQVEPNYVNPAPVNVPRCFFSRQNAGYRAEKITSNGDGMEILLSRTYPSGLPRDSRRVRVKVINYDYNTARIVMEDADVERFITPLPPVAEKSTYEPVGYSVVVEDSNSSLVVYWKGEHASDKPLFNVSLSNLIYSDQFLQLSTILPSGKVYGLGDQKGSLAHSTNWTRRILFNKDQPPRANRALYGAHGFMLNLHTEGRASGVYIKNSNAMDVVLQPTPAATFRTIGGILDFFIFTGPSPKEVFRQYHTLIGLPKMAPYWSFGYHLCRYEYHTLNETKKVFERNIKAGIPLEVQWNDIDYMDRYNMFTYNTTTFEGLPEFADDLHTRGLKYMMIFDPAVSGSEPAGKYPPYDIGLKMDIFLKNMTGDIVPYKVWNEQTSIFPDFSHPKAIDYWTSMFQSFHEQVKFDGAWIDMNEPSIQKNGTNLLNNCTYTQWDFPPVVIGGERLYTYTACMSDKLHAGTMYNMHNHYAHLEARATYMALASVLKKRPLIISRSSSPGQGFWSGHWTGDIDSTWEDMRQSIPDIINFAMFGMPMLGADICGFQYNTTVELCARWQALGAFYPFSRNHNDKVMIDQDPAALGEPVVQATKNTLNKKYYYLPYLYTLFYRAHVQGDTVFRAMMFNFPEDSATHEIDSQFMWGDGLLVIPALYKNISDVTAYLPAGEWYHMNDNGTRYSLASGTNQSFNAPLDDINILIRGGNIIPAQTFAGNLNDSRKNNFTLIVALDSDKDARGEVFWDDGDSLETVESGSYSLIEFYATLGKVITNAVHVGYDKEPLNVGIIKVLGVDKKPTTVTVNGKTLDPISNYTEYRNETKVLEIHSFQIDLLSQINVVEYF